MQNDITSICASTEPSIDSDLQSSEGTALVSELESRLQEVLCQVRESELFSAFKGGSSESELVLATMREVFASIYGYQKRVDEAVFAAIGRFGHHVSEQPLVRSMIAVQLEEIGHGSLALHDYVELGGDETILRNSAPVPEAFVIGAVTNWLARTGHPLAWLGFMFFFERFTTLITEEVAPLLARHGYPDDRLKFMRLHAVEDIRHADMLSNVIVACVKNYSGATEAIRYGFDCFAAVYPLPVWKACYERAKQAISSTK